MTTFYFYLLYVLRVFRNHFNVMLLFSVAFLHVASMCTSVKTTLLVIVPDASSKPIVECSVVTEFTDHICVTMDAELIMFLHDLVSAYLKEKEKGLFLSFIQGWISVINETTARVRTVISTLSREVAAPNTLGGFMAFLLSERKKSTVSAVATWHPS